MEDKPEASAIDEITELIGTDNRNSFNHLHDIVEGLKVITSVEQGLFDDIFGRKSLPAPTAKIAAGSDEEGSPALS